MSEEHVNPVATSGERDKNEADSFNVSALVAEARLLIADCRTYNFGLRNADRLAHEIAPRIADALEAATRERDAALELMNRHKCDEAAEAEYRRVEKLRARVSELEQRDGQQWPELVKSEAERDAALAAIERVREIHESEGWPLRVGCESKEYCVRCNCRWPCATIAALDGAPEPEGRWEYRGRLQSCGYVAEGYISAEHAMNGLKADLEDHPFLVMDDTAIVERARVREWLPVEGESK